MILTIGGVLMMTEDIGIDTMIDMTIPEIATTIKDMTRMTAIMTDPIDTIKEGITMIETEAMEKETVTEEEIVMGTEIVMETETGHMIEE